MKKICNKVNANVDYDINLEMNKIYGVTIRNEVIDFIRENAGGKPNKKIISSQNREYEVRVFLSLDKTDKNYFIEKPLRYFMDNTKGKIIPIGVDSGDNYFCVNNETGKVYYWKSSVDEYFCISENLERFTKLFQ